MALWDVDVAEDADLLRSKRETGSLGRFYPACDIDDSASGLIADREHASGSLLPCHQLTPMVIT